MKNIFILLSVMLLSLSANAQKSDSKLKQEILNEARKSYEYKRIYVAVKESQSYVSMAEKGSIPRSSVISHYNKNLAGYMGKRNTFIDVKKRINKDGDSLIKFVLLKCAAKIALERAAEIE